MPHTTTTTRTRFDYPRFLSLSGSDLVAYMEPIVNDPAAVVDSADLHRVETDLPSFDDYHLVYAIELCTDLLPTRFALPVARCLTHRGQSVRLAAHRVLSRLPRHAITDDLIDACRAAIASGAPTEEIGDLPEILGRRAVENS